MAFAREIIIFILQHVIGFRISEEEKDSYYGVLGNTLVRISNHCTWLNLWDGFLEKNPKYKGWPIVSIVFEDNQNTFQNTCLTLKRFRNTPIKVTEYVYRLQGNGQIITPNDRKSIANSIKNILNGNYVDTTGKCMRFRRVSNNPLVQNINHGNGTTSASNMNYGANTPIEEQITTENIQTKNMKKQTIKLNEGLLKEIIKESIENVLTEKTNYIGNRELNKMADEQEYLSKLFYEFCCSFSRLANNLEKPYKEYATKSFERFRKLMSFIMGRQYKRIDMRYGEQPNWRYDWEHLSNAERRKRTSTDLSEPQWHGFEYDD